MAIVKATATKRKKMMSKEFPELKKEVYHIGAKIPLEMAVKIYAQAKLKNTTVSQLIIDVMGKWVEQQDAENSNLPYLP